MSIKSLLQLILFFLIIIIVGGTYFLYFYSGPKTIVKNEFENLNKTSKYEDNLKIPTDEVMLTENLDEKDVINNITTLDEKKKKNVVIESKAVEGQNLTKEIEYVTTNKKGDILKILADYGKSNISDSNILNLEGVAGVFSSLDKSQINITSEFAEYNYQNQNSKFYKNVIIYYDNKIIKCDNLDLDMGENIAVAYNNVVVKDNSSIMKAQKITMNIITKDISINSKDKIEVLTN